MSPQELERLLGLGEGQRIEFKSGVPRVEVIGSVVCSFLNSGGGYLIYGVQEIPLLPVGVQISNEEIVVIERKIRDSLSPKAPFSLEVQELHGNRLLIAEVPAGWDVPYAFKDKIYIREDEHTHLADVETVRDLVMRKQIEPERWERRFSFADIFADVDTDAVRAAYESIKKNSRATFRSDDDPIRILEDLSSSRYGRLTQGGDVLFGRNPAERYPQVRVRAACYRSDKAGDTFTDMQNFEGPLVRVLEKCHDFILRNTPRRASFVQGGLVRKDLPLYPEMAIREGLVNALVHRDYAGASGGVTIGVYPDRLEIWNSGDLLDGLTPEKLAEGHISILRNPDIAHVLYLRGMMEKLGRGSMAIMAECKSAGLPAPRWASRKNSGVTLTFFAGDVLGGGASDDVRADVRADVRDDAREVSIEVGRLLKVMGDVPMSRRELQEKLDLKNGENFRIYYLQPALTAKFIVMSLPDRPSSSKQRYLITPKGKEVQLRA